MGVNVHTRSLAQVNVVNVHPGFDFQGGYPHRRIRPCSPSCNPLYYRDKVNVVNVYPGFDLLDVNVVNVYPGFDFHDASPVNVVNVDPGLDFQS